MKPTRSLVPVLALALFASTPVLARDSCFAVSNYIDPASVNLVQLMAPPPVAGSAADKRDLAEVLDNQLHRSAAESELARADSEMDIFARFADTLGPSFTAKQLPLTAKLLQRVYCNERQWSHAAKEHFRRNRPFVDHKEVKPLVSSDGFSYPSGHSSFIYTDAIVLAQLLPEKSAAIFARADSYAYNRVVAGVHYPSDVWSGHRLAASIVALLQQDPSFRADAALARQELQRILASH